MVHDILFYLSLHLLFFGLGWWTRPLLGGSFQTGRFYLLSSTGIALAAIAGQFLYFLDIDVLTITRILLVAALAGLIFALNTGLNASRKRTTPAIRSVSRNRPLVLVAGTLLLALPRLAGGQQFSIFQGNHHDTFNYLESSITFSQHNYSFLKERSTLEVIQAGGYDIAKESLHARPGVMLLYAIVTRMKLKGFTQDHYLFQCYFLSISLGVLALLFDRISNTESLLSALLSGAIMAGFWGQYILDINSWSQCASLPLILAFALMTIDSAVLSIRKENPKSGIVEWPLMSVLLSGSLCLYPEASFYYLPALGAVSCLAALKSDTQPAFRFGYACLAAITILLPCWNSTLGFLLRQAISVETNNVNWWTFFQAFLFGRDSINHQLVSNLIDALTATVGVYSWTPAADWPAWLQFVVRLSLSLWLGALALSLVWYFRTREDISGTKRWGNWLLLIVSVLLFQTFVFFLRGRLWGAGKGLSYSAPLLMVLLLAPVTRFQRQSLATKSGIGLLAVFGLLSAQLSFALIRPLGATGKSGIHYARPYPAIQEEVLKASFDWADLSFLQGLQPGSYVAISIDNPWIRSYAKMLLLSHQVGFYLSQPIRANRYSDQILGKDTPAREVSLEIVASLDPSREIFVLRSLRHAPSPAERSRFL